MLERNTSRSQKVQKKAHLSHYSIYFGTWRIVVAYIIANAQAALIEGEHDHEDQAVEGSHGP